MRTGGSNYIAINGDFPHNPVIGRYHEFVDTITSDFRSMYEHGQRQITLTLYYCPLDFLPSGHIWAHVIDSFGGHLFEQHEVNLISLVNLIRDTGFTELHLRFAAQGKARANDWTEWRQEQFDQNSAFIINVIGVVNQTKGSLKVIYDLGMEHAREIWDTNATHQRYCMTLWRNYLGAHLDPLESCAFSVIHGGSGITPMLHRMQSTNAAFPGCYCFDTYNFEYKVLTSAFAVLRSYGQETKPVFIQETYYNDATSCSEIKRAIRDTPGLNFGGIFQWPQMRGAPKGSGCPDVYPKRFDNYLVET
jgi:hypothetical protein